jgi:threonine-phosphate decarboxylase
VTVHGGDVYEVARKFGVEPRNLLDFSANVNPRGLPPRALERLAQDAANPRYLALYSDPSAGALRRALSLSLGVAPESIAIGAGAEALLSPMLRATGARRALLPIPAFSEYHRVCLQEGVEVKTWPLDPAAGFRIPVQRLCEAIRQRHVVFVNNPHNPSGALLDAPEVRQIVDAAQSAGANALLDEAFVDYAPAASLATEAAERPGLIVLRSLTKFFGCPALRVGYAVSHPETTRLIAAFLPTWPVTQLALDALAVALEDHAYAQSSLLENAESRETLRAALQDLGLTVFPSAANFLLIELQPQMPSASELRHRLIQRHRILIRDCDSYEGLAKGRYIRVAVRSDVENHTLIKALHQELVPEQAGLNQTKQV